VPTPVETPCRVVATELRLGPDRGPYTQVVPPVGYRIPKVGGYEHVGARFRFQGADAAAVTEAVLATAADFRLECVTDGAA
jgi:hypothetical protein